MRRAPSLWRSLGTITLLLACESGVWNAVGPPDRLLAALTRMGAPTTEPSGVVIATLALAAEALTAYLLVTVALVALATIPGGLGRSARRLLGRIARPSLRRLLEAALGTLLVTQSALAGPAAFASTPPRPAGVAPTIPRPAPDLAVGSAAWSGAPSPEASSPRLPLLPLPTWLGGTPPVADLPPATAKTRHPAASYTVLPGDCLWTIAAAHLPAALRSDAHIAVYWRQIYAANRGVVGNDPDLVHAGSLLVVPPFTP